MKHSSTSPPKVYASLLFCWVCCGAQLSLLCGNAYADFSDKVVNAAKDATVQVVGDTGAGTGFVVTKEGHVVTNYHVVKGQTKLGIVFCRGNIVAFKRDVTVVVTDPDHDLAILKCANIPSTKPLALAVLEPTGGQSVMAVGFPGVLDQIGMNPLKMGGLTPSGRPDEVQATPEALTFFQPLTSSGTVEKMFHPTPEIGKYLAVMHSAKISHGNSGGPLIDVEGRVVGINVGGKADAKSGIVFAWAIHVSELADLAKANAVPVMIERGKAAPPGYDAKIHMVLLLALAVFAVLVFLLLLRKPRTVMVDAVSRLVHSRRHAKPPKPRPAPAPPQPVGSRMRMRGRDMQGHAHDLTFNDADFHRSGGRLVIGRNDDLSQLVVSHDSVSRQHATLTLLGGAVLVEDRNSGNGCKINGRALSSGSAAVPLRPGDTLTLGEVELIFEILN